MNIRMIQEWSNLLFAHWPVDRNQIVPWLPRGLELDEFEEQAWIAVVPFQMTGIRVFGLPAIPYFSRTLELNVRTYVKLRGQPEAKPGVFFLSLDAASPIAVRIACRFFHLPYFDASMGCSINKDEVDYRSNRIDAEFHGRYRPMGPVFQSRPNTLEHFLTERYCFYTADAQGSLFRGDIQHAPWPLQPAQAQFLANTMTLPWDIVLPATPPLLHFSRHLHVTADRVERLDAHRRF